jgi:hypothetical protein
MNTPLQLESFLMGKSPEDWKCEDSIAVTGSFAAVIDGATNKSTFTASRQDPSPGQRVAALVKEALLQVNAKATARQAIDFITEFVSERLGPRGSAPEPDSAAAVVILSVARREIWRVGDCLFRVDDREYRPITTIDDHIAAVRACYNTTCLIDGDTVEELMRHDKGRELVLPLLKKKYRFRNTETDSPFSFGAIDGSRVPERFIEVHQLPTQTCVVVLCSDGYPRALGTLEESEAYLGKILSADPLCISQLIGTKGVSIGNHSFDDRAYIRFRL